MNKSKWTEEDTRGCATLVILAVGIAILYVAVQGIAGNPWGYVVLGFVGAWLSWKALRGL